ncbi:MAG TPA: PspC domain-containing protein [Solirubrobacteraceae bacterium]|nr:PspC domain-containing protein [Solirubrobacteraceae bacterium]
MSSPETPHDDDQPVTGPTEPLSSGDPLREGPERPGAQAPPPPPPPPRRLTRTEGDKVLGGVAGGLGRYFSIDPIIFRIGFAVLTLVGGAGVLGYLAAWLLVPSDGAPGEPRTGANRVLAIVGGVILAIAALAFLGPGLVFLGPPLLGLGLVALVGVLLWRAAGGGQGDDANRVARRLGLGLLLLVVAGAGFVAVAVGAAVGGGAVIAGLVIAVGVALVVGAFLGGARWLVIPALVLAVPLGLVAAAGIDVQGGIGERHYRPTTVSELRGGYELGMGELSLDLRDLDFPAGRTQLKVDVGIGDVQVLVPEDVCVASAARVGAGYIGVLDRENSGLDVDWRQSPAENAGVKRLVIDADLGVGALQVAHNRGAFDFSDGEHGPGPRFGSDFPFDTAERNDACTESA